MAETVRPAGMGRALRYESEGLVLERGGVENESVLPFQATHTFREGEHLFDRAARALESRPCVPRQVGDRPDL